MEEGADGLGGLAVHKGGVAEVGGAHGAVVVGLQGVFKPQVVLVPAAVNHLAEGDGPAEVHALQLVAANAPQEADVLLRLHALHHCVYPQLQGHFHQLGQDDPALGAGVELAQEGHVKLNQVEVKGLQQVQGGIAAAEVVHPHLVAHGAQSVDLGAHILGILRHGALGDLHVQQVTAHAGGRHPPLDLLHHVAGGEVGPGDVHRHRHDVYAARRLLLHGGQRLVHHVQIQFVDEARLLQRGDELRRGQQPLVRVNPPCQRLLVADAAVGRADNGLEIGLNPALAEGLVQMLQDVIAVVRRLQKGGVEAAAAGGIGGGEHIAGHLGPVHRRQGGDVLRHVPVNAHVNRQGAPAVEGGGLLVEVGQQGVKVHVAAEGGKVVLSHAAYPLRSEAATQHLGHRLQQPVTLLIAKQAVEQLHAVHVEEQNGEGLPLVCQLLPGRLGQCGKIIRGGDAGERILSASIHEKASVSMLRWRGAGLQPIIHPSIRHPTLFHKEFFCKSGKIESHYWKEKGFSC